MKTPFHLLTPLLRFAGLRNPAQRIRNGVAFNAAAIPSGLALAVGVATNADVPAIPQTGDELLLLAPYGETGYWHEEKPGGWKQYRQVFQRPQAEAMAAAFNTLAAKRGAKFRGLPIYSGHPDGDPQRWPDERRLGAVMGVEAREDGVYVRAAWNDLGEQNRAQGYLVYPSPAWLYDLRKARTTGVIAPDELRSVGLTNSPRIADVPAWTNSDATHERTQEPMNEQLRKKLLKLLKLADTTTDEELALAINTALPDGTDVTLEGLRALATNAETTLSGVRGELATEQGRVLAANTERDTARREATSFRGVAMNALLDGAIVAGRLSAADRATFVPKFEADFDAAKTELTSRKVALNTSALNLTRPDVGDLNTPAGRRTAYNAQADELKRLKKCDTEADVTAAMRQDPAGRLILEAMEAADKPATAAK